MKPILIILTALLSISTLFSQEGKKTDFIRESKVTNDMRSRDVNVVNFRLIPHLKTDTLSDPEYMEVTVRFDIDRPDNASKAMLCLETSDGTSDIGIYEANFVKENNKISLESNGTRRPMGRNNGTMIIRMKQEQFLKVKASIYIIDNKGKLSNTFKYRF